MTVGGSNVSIEKQAVAKQALAIAKCQAKNEPAEESFLSTQCS